MYDLDAIEAINFEQLATVTDRLLLRGRYAKRRLSTNRCGTHRMITQFARGSQPEYERTVVVAPSNLWRRFATSALITAVLSVTAAIVILI